MNEFELPVEEKLSAHVIAPEPEAPKESWGSKWRDASRRWAKETTISYFSNPAARRDFVVQFRGNRSSFLFAAFLLIMGCVALFEYWSISTTSGSIMEVQRRLTEFYEAILIVLGIAITLVAPAMAATAVVAEKQRKSLDLVFCSPVRPRVYLIGKIIAVYRYTWILMALSLPFTAMSVILGGASWVDVLSSYFMLSIQGLVLTSMGLLFSSVTEKAVSAILYTYGGVIAYLVATGYLAAMTRAMDYGGSNRSFFELLNPFAIYDALGSSTMIAGIPVPNVLLATAACLVMIRLFLAAAGAALVPPRPRERADLRLSATGVLAGSAGLTAFLVSQSQAINNSFGPSAATWLGAGLFAFMLPLAAFMPFLSCYGMDSERQVKPNGIISWAKTLTGTPASALTFTWFLIATTLAAMAAGTRLGGVTFDVTAVAAYAAYTTAFWSFFWSIGRLASSFLLGVKASRTLQFLSFVAIVGGPVPILTFLAGTHNGSANAFTFPWNLYILSPLFHDAAGVPLVIWTVVLTALAAMIAWWSEQNLRHRLSRKGAGLSEIERATGRFADSASG